MQRNARGIFERRQSKILRCALSCWRPNWFETRITVLQIQLMARAGLKLETSGTGVWHSAMLPPYKVQSLQTHTLFTEVTFLALSNSLTFALSSLLIKHTSEPSECSVWGIGLQHEKFHEKIKRGNIHLQEDSNVTAHCAPRLRSFFSTPAGVNYRVSNHPDFIGVSESCLKIPTQPWKKLNEWKDCLHECVSKAGQNTGYWVLWKIYQNQCLLVFYRDIHIQVWVHSFRASWLINWPQHFDIEQDITIF